MTDWYYADAAHTRQGPVSTDELRRLRDARKIDDATLLWRDGLPAWRPLRDLAHELAPSSAPEEAVAAPHAWTLAPIEAAPTASTRAAPDDGDWRPVTEQAGQPETGSGTGWTPPASPYAPPASPVVRPDVVVQGGEVVLAGFRKRAAAYIIDGAIVGIGGMVLGTVLVGILGAVIGFGRADGDLALVLVQIGYQLVSIALTAVYYAWFHASRAMATPGKMAVGIKVVRPDGARISVARGVGRYFATFLSALILCIGFLLAAFTQRKQALHDMICDTLVVDRWAFTDRPDLQRRDLGTVAVVVLAITGVLLGLGMLLVLGALGMAVLA